MTVETGVVFRKFEKEYRGKTLYSFTFDNRDDDRFFRLGENEELFNSFAEGDTVKIKHDTDRRGNHVVEKLKVESKGSGKPASSGGGRGGSRTGGGARGGNSREDYWQQKSQREIEVVEPRITLASSIERAIPLVALVIEHGGVKLPAKTAVVERGEVILGLVKTYAQEIYEAALNDPASYFESASFETAAPAEQDEDDFGDDDDADDEDF